MAGGIVVVKKVETLAFRDIAEALESRRMNESRCDVTNKFLLISSILHIYNYPKTSYAVVVVSCTQVTCGIDLIGLEGLVTRPFASEVDLTLQV